MINSEMDFISASLYIILTLFFMEAAEATTSIVTARLLFRNMCQSQDPTSSVIRQLKAHK